MGKLKIILTVDYEVSGDGSGSVDSCIIDPAERMMQLCEKYNAKLTFFTDVCEYWAFKEVKESGKYEDGLDPANKITNQIKDIYRRGHDIQLHLHPQWIDYKYMGNNNWILNMEFWRLPNVKLLGENAIYNLFERGKNTLEKIISEVNPNYCCDVFRAGALCIQPEEEILKVMQQLNFKIESSVTVGVKFNDGKTIYDFTNAIDDLPEWNILNNLQSFNKNGLIKEVPIFTAKVPFIKDIKFAILRMLRKINSNKIECKQDLKKNSKTSILFRVYRSIKSKRRRFSFGDENSFEELKYMTKKAKIKYQALSKTKDVPIVMISHTKTFGNGKEFEKYLRWANKKEYIEFSNFHFLKNNE